MKVPLSWLKEYVDFDMSAKELAQKLTFSGIEVEGIETVGADYTGIVVGEVTAIAPHPDADRLSLCKVNNGVEELAVVCGAHNFQVGDKVPFIGVGLKLPDGTKIKKAKIRGETSFGMICSERELAISDSHEGIMVLDRSLAPGTLFSKVVGDAETVLELEVTWNRPDCLCIIGIAREIAALLGVKLKVPFIEFHETGDAVEKIVKVSVEDPEKCHRYIARVLSGVKLGPSPVWMQKRLALCGVRAINNVVDITNYVMLECGQPLHAFDYRLLSGGEIIVRCARQGEKMSTLDGIQRAITPDMLMIADSQRPVAIAGVMGGLGSEIVESTNTVLLESASFNAAGIKRTSTQLGLATESSHRFERGVDVERSDWASRRAACLMVEHAGASAARGVVDVFPVKHEQRRLKCRFDRVNGLLGVEVPPSKVTAIFESLEIKVVEQDNDGCVVEPPVFRGDLRVEADLIEEIARMNGLDKIPVSVPEGKIVPEADDMLSRAVMGCRRNLIGLGFMEIMNYSFVSNQALDLFCAGDADERVVLPNPVSTDYGVLRNSLVPQLMECFGRNFSRQVDEASFFEIGRVFWRENGQICEEERIGLGLMGSVGRPVLDKRRQIDREEMFFWLKGAVDAVCVAQHLDGVMVVKNEHPYFEGDFSVEIRLKGERIGVMGLLKRDICANWRIFGPVGVAELQLKPLISGVFGLSGLKPIPIYPSITRDISMVVDDVVMHEDIVNVIKKNAPKELTGVQLFDIFKTEGVKGRRKSLAYSLTYRSFQKTLTDEDANRYHELVKDALKRELKVEIREG